jgi:2-C-methyl-D-erythritol 2,4-cyclodiphosphate synthase
MRIGHGYDIHAFIAGDHVMLGGVRIDHTKGVKAHSDGDVVLHALCDALLGAAALGDIGRHFPDTDPKWKGAESRMILQETVKLVAGRKLKPSQVDVTVIAEAPKLAPHIMAMRVVISRHLDIPLECVNVKATTHEGLGAIGRGEGLAAHAVVLLEDI